MRLIKGNYETAKLKVKEIIYEGYKLDEAFNSIQLVDLTSSEVVKLYSELKQLFENSMIISINLLNNDAKNLYTNSVVSMNKYIDGVVINKMVNKFRSNVEKDLFNSIPKKQNKNLDYINRIMEAANNKITEGKY